MLFSSMFFSCIVSAVLLLNSCVQKNLQDSSNFASSSTSSESLVVNVEECLDGDTCRIRIKGSPEIWIKVRLFGIDAPEMSKDRGAQEYAQEARDYLNSQLKGESFEMIQVDLDRYNRPVVEFHKKADNIGLQLVELGLAEAYRGPTKGPDRKIYFDAEQKAKSRKIGIWSVSERISPRNFRKGR